MSDRMSASSAQASEKKPWQGDRVTNASEPLTPAPFTAKNPTWKTVTISPSNDIPGTATMTCEEDSRVRFSGQNTLTDLLLFESTEGDYVNISQIDKYFVLTYFARATRPMDPPTVGVWMGTSSGCPDPTRLVKT